MAPDPNSRSEVEEGRRLVRQGQFLYRLPTFEHYQRARDHEARKAQWREQKARQRRKAAEDAADEGGQSEDNGGHVSGSTHPDPDPPRDPDPDPEQNPQPRGAESSSAGGRGTGSVEAWYPLFSTLAATRFRSEVKNRRRVISDVAESLWTQGMTLEQLQHLIRTAKREGDNPAALLAHWIGDGKGTKWRAKLAEASHAN